MFPPFVFARFLVAMSAIIPLKAFFPYNRPAPSGASRRVGARRDVFSGIFFSLIWHARCRAEEHKDAAGAGLSPRSHAHVDTAVASPAHTCLLGSDFVVVLANMRVSSHNLQLPLMHVSSVQCMLQACCVQAAQSAHHAQTAFSDTRASQAAERH